MRDLRRRDPVHHPVLLGGSVPADHHPEDRAELAGETVPDGTQVCRDQEFEKTWEIRNSGDRPWRDRWLTRQGAAGTPGWLRSPARARLPDAVPGEIVTVPDERCRRRPRSGRPRRISRSPTTLGVSTTPGPESPPVYCTIFTVYELVVASLPLTSAFVGLWT